MTLTYDNCHRRVGFYFYYIDMRREMFPDVFNEIKIVKKWFYLIQVMRKYYLGND